MTASWRFIYALDLLALTSFIISYYFNCYRKGFRIDIWHAQLFLYCVLPDFIMLPFATGQLNAIVLGSDYVEVVRAVPMVFFVSLLGYFFFLLGGILWRIKLGVGIRKAATRVLDILPNCSLMVMSSRGLLLSLGCFCLVFQTSLLLLYFSQNGFGFDLRAYTFAHPELRPVALLASNFSIFTASHCIARYIDTKERTMLVCALGLAIGLIFFGARANIILIFQNIMWCYFILLRRKISLIRIGVLLVALVVVALYAGNAREGNFGIGDFMATLAFLLVYGNNFSDLRDFAWVYVHWNHTFWHGKTYLAAVTSFVPRFVSSFRDTWALGATTAATVGFDPQVHPGLRPGSFGESYFNFGILGVVATGILLGVLTKRVDVDTKLALTSDHPSMMKAFASTILLNVTASLAVSAGFSTIYVMFVFFFFSWVFLKLQKLWHDPTGYTGTQLT